MTRWGRLFRADGLSRLSVADIEVLLGIGIRNVIDLRTDLEVESRGRFPDGIPGVSYQHLPLTDTLPGAEQSPDWDDAEFVAARYFSMLQCGISSVEAALTLMATTAELPAVYHCSVGKDRTGVLSAVVLGLLGVPDELIVTDYALSAEPMRHILGRLQQEYPDSAAMVEQFAPVILSVKAESMEGFLSMVHARYGSFDGFADELGLHDTVKRLRERLLIEA